MRAAPVSLSLIALSVVGFLLVKFNAIQWVATLTYTDFHLGTDIDFIETEGQYWRLITPIFLHFGWLHIAFNSLWVWEVGVLIERRLGSFTLLALALVSAAGSNAAQHIYSGPSLFGGMSGVVYALLGFCATYHWLHPARGLVIQRGILLFMLVWLVFCMVVPTRWLGFGFANAAHLGGLLIGLLAGVVLGCADRGRAGR